MLGVSILPAEPALAWVPEREFGLHQFDLMVLLILDVVFDHVLIQSRGGHKVSSAPQCSERELLRLFLDPRG